MQTLTPPPGPDEPLAPRRRHPLVTALAVLAALAVLGLVGGAVYALVHLASTARETASARANHDDCDPYDDPNDTRNLCLYPTRPDVEPDDHEAAMGDAVRLAGFTASVDEAFIHQLVLDDQLAIRVTVRNRDDKAQPYGPLDWKVETGDERIITPAANERDDAFEPGELAPGEEATGTITYDLPPGTYYVVFRPDLLNHARGIWQIEVTAPD